MFDHFSNSWALATSSWRILREEKKFILFPIFSGIGCLAVSLSFIVPLFLARPWHQFVGVKGPGDVPPWVYAVAFAFYFCNYFVVIFCNAALVSCALLKFHGETPSISAGFEAAVSRLPQILAWALVSATVGLLLKAIEGANDKVGKLISAVLGTAWSIMTFFVVPVLVVEKTGPVEAVKRSVQILKKTWGEALVGRTGIGLFLLVGWLPAALLLGLGVALFHANVTAALACFALFLAYGLVWSAVGSAVGVIFQTALYQYAAYDEVPPGFEPDAIRSAFRAKKAR